MMIDAGTRLAGVIGDPIGHSLSPAIHNAALRHDGRNAVYLAMRVVREELAGALRGLRALGAVGVNVTIPHKVDALGLADRRSAAAERIGAANTLVWRSGSEGPVLEAHNTDPVGVLEALADLGLEVSGGAFLLLGAGGAGRAAAWALAGAGAGKVLVANRSPERSADLVGGLRQEGFPAEAVEWASREERLSGVEAVVNATSVGMGAETSPLGADALAGAAVGRCRVVLDLVYGRGETSLVTVARGAGLRAADGVGVLVHQAAAAYELFWDAPAPLDVIVEAAGLAVGRRSPRPTSEERDVPPIV